MPRDGSAGGEAERGDGSTGTANGLVLLRVESDHAVVRPGQDGVQVDLVIAHHGEAPALLQDAALSFWSQGQRCDELFSATVSETPRPVLEAGGQARWRFEVAVAASAPPGEVEVDARAWALIERDLIEVSPAQTRLRWQVVDDGSLIALRVEPGQQVLVPGQRAVPVRVIVVNQMLVGVSALEAELVLRRETGEDPSGFVQEADLANSRVLPAGGGATLTLWLTVPDDAAPGAIVIDATLAATRDDGAALQVPGAVEPARVQVEALPVLVVSTTEDEDDTAGAPSLAAAGGAADLSLREAMLIANANAVPTRIGFDPAEFPVETPAAIEISSALGPLPAITCAGLRLDGRGAGVRLVGRQISSAVGVQIAADDVTLQQIEISDFNTWSVFGQKGGRCVAASGVDRIQLISCRFINCGWASGTYAAAVDLVGGDGHVVHGCYADGLDYGVELSSGTARALVSGNELVRSGRGLMMAGTGHVVSDNLIGWNTRSGIELRAATHVTLRANRYQANSGSGLLATNGCHDIVAEAEEITGSAGDAVKVAQGSAGVAVRGVVFEGNTGAAIAVEPGANDDVLPPQILGFDGQVVRGSAAQDGSVVEVYSVGARQEPLATTRVSGGAWQVELPRPQPAVQATLTSPAGSTSPMSAPASP